MRGLIVVAVMALAAAACTPKGTIEGQKIRGTAQTTVPSQQAHDPVKEAAREFWNKAAKDMIEALDISPEDMRRGHYSDRPEVQAQMEKIMAARAALEDSGDLHHNAPRAFKKWWSNYLDTTQGRYAVFAVDRNMRGAGFVYCQDHQCQSSPMAWKMAKFNHGAVKNCRRYVREFNPAHRPDCAIYAIKDKIVWEGPMPWE